MKLLTKEQTEEGELYMTTYDAQEYCIQKVADFRNQLLDAECVRGMIIRGEIVLPPEWEEMSKEKKIKAILADCTRYIDALQFIFRNKLTAEQAQDVASDALFPKEKE